MSWTKEEALPRRDGLFQEVEALIFDCDGVLVDSFLSNSAYYNRVLAELGLPELTVEQADFVHAATAEKALEYIVPPEKRNALPKVMAAIDYYADFLPLLKPSEGLFSALELFKKHGLFLGVNTNRAASMFEIIKIFGLERFFKLEAVITSDMAAPKPSPHGLELLSERFSLNRKAMVFIGDSQVDARTAQAAGMRFWAFGGASWSAEAHISGFVHLEHLFSDFLTCRQP